MKSEARNRWNFPDLGVGIGLRTVHYAHILETKPEVDKWVTAIHAQTEHRNEQPLTFSRSVDYLFNPFVMDDIDTELGSP